jgi:hypothetical protein
MNNVLNYKQRANYKTIYSFEAPTISYEVDINDLEQIAKLKLTRYFEIINNKPVEVKIFGIGSLADQEINKKITIRIIIDEYNVLVRRVNKAIAYMDNENIPEEAKEKCLGEFKKLSNEVNCLYLKLINYGIFNKERNVLKEVYIYE